jgi:hypothetical protein
MTNLELRNNLFSVALGAYAHQGFKIEEHEDTINLYCHSCGLVDRFTQLAAASLGQLTSSCRSLPFARYAVTKDSDRL